MPQRSLLIPLIPLLTFTVLVGTPASIGGIATADASEGESAATWSTLLQDPTERPCYDCEEQEDEYGELEHRFNLSDRCGVWYDSGGEGLIANASEVEAHARLAQGEGGGGCARCGGTSECHSGWDAGACHVQCYLGVNDRARIREAVRLANARAVREILSETDGIVYNAKRRSLQLRTCDGKAIGTNIPLTADFAAELEDVLADA